MALPLFAITLFVSAFLLFLVQPMIGKLILPKLGGTPQVWNTCMVFFQSVLLLGYAYTHTVSTKLKLRQQLVLHCALLVIPIGLVIYNPFYEAVRGWSPPAGSNPIPQTLLLLAIVVGIPFFVVSTSAPLLQKWFAYSGDKAAQDPYFLYGASNLGSLLSLLFYPALIEPYATLPTQTNIWLYGYIALAGLIAYCAYKIYLMAPPDSVLEAQHALATAAAEAPAAPAAPLTTEQPPPAPAPVPAAQASTSVKAGPGPGGGRSISRKKGKHHHGAAAPTAALEEEKSIAKPGPAPLIATGATAPMTAWRRIRWVLLAAIPSSLMLGVTNYISTDLSPFPLVWVVPLALYLLAFILVFWKPWTGKRYQVVGGAYTPHEMVLYLLQPLGLVVLCFILLSRGFSPFGYTMMAMFGFFATALACHGELAQDRPATRYLTEYFLWMSVGGMVGGLFNGIIAPIIFQTGVWEFHVAIIIACVIRPQYMPSGWFDDLILNAFPGLQAWSRNQGDEMAKSFGKPTPHTTYLFSLFLDVIFGLFILSIAYWLTNYFHTRGNLDAVMKFLQLPRDNEYIRDKWARITLNVFVYFIPLVFCFFFAGRPLRLSLAMSGLLFANLYLAEKDERRVLETRRTYFGLLRVQEDVDGVRNRQENDLFRDPDAMPPLTNDEKEQVAPHYPYTFLMHGTTYHGRNYYRVYDDKYQKYRVDLSRLATTYYHRYGPVGVVMEPYNWWSMPAKKPVLTEDEKKRRREANPGAQNDWSADLRMPATMIGQFMGCAGMGQDPLAMLGAASVDGWSEPPIATIGLGTGTMASYARPYGWMTYYEIDDVIRHFSLPEGGGDARFTYLQNAIRRGVNLEVLMGDARQTLERETENLTVGNSHVFFGNFSKPKTGEKYPYANAPYNHDTQYQCKSAHREGFYRVINVDAFSSDAIPVHLVTKQAIKLYLSKMHPDGVLCVHTSNRHMDLVRPVARIAMELSKESEADGGPKIGCIVGKDGDKGRFMGHFSSEYVMIFRGDGFQKHVDTLKSARRDFIANYNAAQKDRDAADKQEREGKFAMGAEHVAPEGWQILNSAVEWYNPYENVGDARFGHKAVTVRDSVWTDDYTSILPLLR